MSNEGKEVWLLGMGAVQRSADVAKTLEDFGWSGMQLTDTQCLAPDAYIELALAVSKTSRIKLSTGVTNPVTRDPSVTASSAAALQAESDGRIQLVIGRGDSSLGHIGQEEGVKLKDLRLYTERLQAYLNGQVIDREGFPSALRWMEGREQKKVPVIIAGTGPKVTEMAAKMADGIGIASVQSQEQLLEKIRFIEDVLEREGRKRSDFTINVYTACALNEDKAVALDAMRGVIVSGMRFSGMTPAALENLDEEARPLVQRIANEYDMMDHLKANTTHAKLVPDAMIEKAAGLGSADEIADRYNNLLKLPIDSVTIQVGSRDTPYEVLDESISNFSKQVLPHLNRFN